MDDTEAGHRNLLEFAREDARWQSSHTVLDADGLLAFAGTSGFPVFNNGAHRTDDALFLAPAPA